MKCKKCEIEVFLENTEKVDNRCIGVHFQNEIYCIPCHEVLIFMGASRPRKKKSDENDKPNKQLRPRSVSKTVYLCLKCEKELFANSPTCKDCNWTHPLLIRPVKKKKKKKRSKKK